MSRITAEPMGNALLICFHNSSIKTEGDVSEAASLLAKYLGAHDKKKMVIDLSRVNFMTSSMIGELVKLKKNCDKRKIKLRLCGLSGDLDEIFKITKMNKLFPIYDSREKACK